MGNFRELQVTIDILDGRPTLAVAPPRPRITRESSRSRHTDPPTGVVGEAHPAQQGQGRSSDALDWLQEVAQWRTEIATRVHCFEMLRRAAAPSGVPLDAVEQAAAVVLVKALLHGEWRPAQWFGSLGQGEPLRSVVEVLEPHLSIVPPSAARERQESGASPLFRISSAVDYAS